MQFTRGCETCRVAKVKVGKVQQLITRLTTFLKCDKIQPICGRCERLRASCSYRESDPFRSQNEVAETNVQRRLLKTSTSVQTQPVRDCIDESVLARHALMIDSCSWLRDIPASLSVSLNDQANDIFFSNYILHPCNHGLSPGYLERLPELLSASEKRSTLECCCSAASLAYLAVVSQQNDIKIRAHQTYQRALTALNKSITTPADVSSNRIVTALLVVDFFDMFLGQNPQHLGPHSKALAAVLALRNESILLSMTGFSTFRVANQRVQIQQILSIVSGEDAGTTLVEQKRCLGMLNPASIYTQLTMANQKIISICSCAEKLLRSEDKEASQVQTCVGLISEMKELYSCITTANETRLSSLRSREVHRPSDAPRPTNAIIDETKLLVYHDLWSANEWTLHQGFLLILLDYIARLLHLLLKTGEHAASFRNVAVLNQEFSGVLSSLQAVVEAIFASVPMLAGTIDGEGNFFPDVRGKRIGAFLVLSPLKLICVAQHTSLDQKTKATNLLQQMHLYMGRVTMS